MRRVIWAIRLGHRLGSGHGSAQASEEGEKDGTIDIREGKGGRQEAKERADPRPQVSGLNASEGVRMISDE